MARMISIPCANGILFCHTKVSGAETFPRNSSGFSINGAFLKPLKIQVVECHKKNNLNSRMRRNEKWQNIMTENLKNR